MRPQTGLRVHWAALRADPARSSRTARPAATVRAQASPGELPAWLRGLLYPGGTGGHRASVAEKRAVYAAFEASRAAARRRGAPGAVFASMRPPGGVSPFAQRVFGAGR